MLTSSTTFEEAFDIMFVRGGFSRFKSCWDFVKTFENPANDRWIQALCLCRLMELLPHPMLGVLLLVPEVRSLQESRDVWKLARECCVAVVDVDIVVRVIRMFCPRVDDQVLFGGALRTSQIHEVRSKVDWGAFAKNAADGIAFTGMWWAQEENLGLEGADIRAVVVQMSKKEGEMLRFKLLAHAKKEMLDEKVWKVEKLRDAKKKPVSAEEKKHEPEVENESVSEPKTKKGKTKDVVKKPTPIRLSNDELKVAESVSQTKTEKHLQVLSTLKKALARTGVAVLEHDLAGIVTGITTEYPRIKWNLKAALHEHFKTQSAWEIEREMHGYEWFKFTEDPLATLNYWESAQ